MAKNLVQPQKGYCLPSKRGNQILKITVKIAGNMSGCLSLIVRKIKKGGNNKTKGSFKMLMHSSYYLRGTSRSNCWY